MTIASIDSVIQGATLLVLAATVLYAARQAKASESMARFSLQQTELMRAQMHAAFRPFVIVTGGEYGAGCASLTLKNVGLGPALMLSGLYRGGYRQSVGSLEPGKTETFFFDSGHNIGPPPLSPSHEAPKPTQAVALSLEYQSVTGARCWTHVDFPLGRKGSVEPEMEHGMDLSLAGK